MASGVRVFDPTVDWKTKEVAPPDISVGASADVRRVAPWIFGDDRVRQQKFEQALKLELQQQIAKRGLATVDDSKQAFGVDIWGHMDNRDRECHRVIYSLRLWFRDDRETLDDETQPRLWAREVLGSASESTLESDLLSTVRDLLDYHFPEGLPSRQ